MLNRYTLARILGGLLGRGAWYLIWQSFWDAVLWEVPDCALDAALDSSAMVTLIRLAAVALIMAPGLALSTLAEHATMRLSRTSVLANSMLDKARAESRKAMIAGEPTWRAALGGISIGDLARQVGRGVGRGAPMVWRAARAIDVSLMTDS